MWFNYLFHSSKQLFVNASASDKKLNKKLLSVCVEAASSTTGGK